MSSVSDLVMRYSTRPLPNLTPVPLCPSAPSLAFFAFDHAQSLCSCSCSRSGRDPECESPGATAIPSRSQADKTSTLIAAAEKDILHKGEHHSWAHLDADHLDRVQPFPNTRRKTLDTKSCTLLFDADHLDRIDGPPQKP